MNQRLTAVQILERRLYETHIRGLAEEADECIKYLRRLHKAIEDTDGEYDHQDKNPIIRCLESAIDEVRRASTLLSKMKNKDDK